ncbi:MFS transporter [Lentzea sp. NPDC051213]|uniref:MFS transporter n=1 Tax=Lentzea sp. NPDC051213 TaxID=3364126 RepID=UPI0037B1CC59
MTQPRTHAMTLAIGIVALEFAAAVSTFVSSTLLPAIVRDLSARDAVELLIAGSTLGLFVALPLATRVVRRIGSRGTLAAGMVAYVAGTAASAVSGTAWVFAGGQFVSGCASGLLAVFGISAAIQHLDDQWRMRVIAASSAMWILPALVGPAATLALEHLVGWRWTLLVPVPVVFAGRVLILRAAGSERPSDGAERPLWRTLLVPLGVSGVVLSDWWPFAVGGVALALVGVASIMPAGTLTARRGAPAALVAMTLFAAGYFGADGLITVLLTDGYGASMARAAVVLSAAPLAWAVTSLAVPRLKRIGKEPPPAAGLTLTAVAVGALAWGAPVFAVALVAWTLGGVGVGLAYPCLYLRSTTGAEFGATELAAAVITAEAFGGLLGRAVGGAIVSVGDLGAAYWMFAGFLGLGAALAVRSKPLLVPQR